MDIVHLWGHIQVTVQHLSASLSSIRAAGSQGPLASSAFSMIHSAQLYGLRPSTFLTTNQNGRDKAHTSTGDTLSRRSRTWIAFVFPQLGFAAYILGRRVRCFFMGKRQCKRLQPALPPRVDSCDPSLLRGWFPTFWNGYTRLFSLSPPSPFPSWWVDFICFVLPQVLLSAIDWMHATSDSALAMQICWNKVSYPS